MSEDELLSLWRNLVADPDAGGAFAEAVLPDLERRAASLGRGGDDPHALADACEETVMGLLRSPGSFDPAKMPLSAYLLMSVRGDLANIRARVEKRRRVVASWGGVELDELPRNMGVEADSLADFPEIRAVVESLTGEDAVMLRLLCEGERRTAVCAAALGVGHLSPKEQADHVKRVRDRVIAKLKRAGRAGDGGDT